MKLKQGRLINFLESTPRFLEGIEENCSYFYSKILKDKNNTLQPLLTTYLNFVDLESEGTG
jgi:hypothetical protein